MLHLLQSKTKERSRRLLTFYLAIVAAMTLNAMTELQVDAVSLLSESVSAWSGTAVTEDRIVVISGEEEGVKAILPQGVKVTVKCGEAEDYATTRRGETVGALVKRLKLNLTPLEMVFVDIGEKSVTVVVTSDHTFYETVQEAAAYTKVTVADHTMPKGETRVVQGGANGTRDVVYEIIYADGELLSRQAVSESNDTSVPEVTHYGTLVKDAREGDTIASVVWNSDGSGYLKMKSGDSLHFTGSMKVTCTAYTANVGKVGTITATGTKVHRGTMAVDRKVIPLGTKMFAVGSTGYTYGQGIAEDTGVRGAWVDLYMNTLNECRQFGRQNNSTVYFLDK